MRGPRCHEQRCESAPTRSHRHSDKLSYLLWQFRVVPSLSAHMARRRLPRNSMDPSRGVAGRRRCRLAGLLCFIAHPVILRAGDARKVLLANAQPAASLPLRGHQHRHSEEMCYSLRPAVWNCVTFGAGGLGNCLTDNRYSSTTLSAGSLAKGNNPKTLRSSCGSISMLNIFG